MAERPVGTVTHYFGTPQVGIVALSGRVATGDTLRFLGHGADFRQTVKSMQLDHVGIDTASTGTEVGIRVNKRVREGTTVYRVTAGSQGWFGKLKALFLSE